MAALRRGSKGSDVSKLQTTLKEQGYYKGNIDGSYGPQTLAAVKSYQQAKGLAVDGIAGPKTQGSLFGGTKLSPVSSAGSTLKPPTPIATPKPTAQMLEGYRKDAAAQYDPTYNQKVEALKNQLAQSLLAYEGQRTGLNQAYDDSVKDRKLRTTLEKNDYNLNTLDRGLGRSTVFTSNMAALDQKGNRLVDDINKRRTSDIGALESQIAGTKTAHEASLAAMQADRASAIESLARQLEDQAYQRQLEQDKLSYQKYLDQYNQALQKEQFEYQKQHDAQLLALQREQLAAQKAAKSYGGSSGSSGYYGYNSKNKSSGYYGYNSKNKKGKATTKPAKNVNSHIDMIERTFKSTASYDTKMRDFKSYISAYQSKPGYEASVKKAKDYIGLLDKYKSWGSSHIPVSMRTGSTSGGNSSSSVIGKRQMAR